MKLARSARSTSAAQGRLKGADVTASPPRRHAHHVQPLLDATPAFSGACLHTQQQFNAVLEPIAAQLRGVGGVAATHAAHGPANSAPCYHHARHTRPELVGQEQCCATLRAAARPSLQNQKMLSAHIRSRWLRFRNATSGLMPSSCKLRSCLMLSCSWLVCRLFDPEPKVK